MPTDVNIGTTDPETVAMQSEARHQSRREAAMHHLAGHGMHPDRDLLAIIDLSSVKEVGGRMVVPHDFHVTVRKAHPNFFAEEAQAFNARTASADDVNKRLADMTRDGIRRRNAGLAEREMAGLRARYAKAS